MYLYHATPSDNLVSIVERGLDVDKAAGALKACWMCNEKKVAWAILHVAKRHKVLADQVVVCRIRVPRPWLIRSRVGLWYCLRDIPADRIVGCIGAIDAVA
jgi:hypothetical protein